MLGAVLLKATRSSIDWASLVASDGVFTRLRIARLRVHAEGARVVVHFPFNWRGLAVRVAGFVAYVSGAHGGSCSLWFGLRRNWRGGERGGGPRGEGC